MDFAGPNGIAQIKFLCPEYQTGRLHPGFEFAVHGGACTAACGKCPQQEAQSALTGIALHGVSRTAGLRLQLRGFQTFTGRRQGTRNGPPLSQKRPVIQISSFGKNAYDE